MSSRARDNDKPNATNPDSSNLANVVARAADALLTLGDSRGQDLPRTLALLLEVIANEAARTPRFANSLSKALTAAPAPPTDARPHRPHRRAPGCLDPFAVYAAQGEAGLRALLGELSLEQLRDIIAEHGMDHDRLAMKWKDPARVIDRIVERVTARAAKGSAFRTPTSRAGE